MILKHKNPFHVIQHCKGCILKQRARRQVIGRGSLPADMLFLGEGPGKTEDLLGEPFVGPSGNLLNRMITDAALQVHVKVPSYYITNTVLCRPWIWNTADKDYGNNREPTKTELLACMPNIIAIAAVVKPKIVIFVGRISEQFYRKEFPNSLHITHPAAHLRYGGVSSPTYQLDVRNLSEIFKGLFHG